MTRAALLTAVASAALAGACARSPDSIPPAYVSPVAYEAYDCAELSQELARVERALRRSADQQSDARTNDALGWLFLGQPVSTHMGDNVSERIARHKGERQAIRETLQARGCPA